MIPPELTVVIPSYNPDPALLHTLYDSLMQQTFSAFEVVIVDDASTAPGLYKWIQDPRFRVVRQPGNRGPAACRNLGANAATTEFLFFTDTDCALVPETLEQAVNHLHQSPILIGNTITRAVTSFGKAVALLGFPGGGLLGFDQVWRVDEDGYTNSFSSCNLAFRKTVFEALGGFDESFPVAGGEDTVLAWQATRSGCRIRYVPEMQVYHIEKSNLREFVRWQITRGRGTYHIKRHVGKVGGYLRLRLWTFKNSLRAAGPRYALPVCALIALSVYYQLKGMALEKRDARRRNA